MMVKWLLDDHMFGPFMINNGCCICQRLFYGHDTRFFIAFFISPLFAQHPMVPSLISPQMPVDGDSQVLSILVAGIYMSFSEVSVA